LLKKRLGQKQDSIDDLESDLSAAVADVLTNTQNLDGNFKADAEMLASQIHGTINVANGYLRRMEAKGVVFSYNGFVQVPTITNNYGQPIGIYTYDSSTVSTTGDLSTAQLSNLGNNVGRVWQVADAYSRLVTGLDNYQVVPTDVSLTFGLIQTNNYPVYNIEDLNGNDAFIGAFSDGLNIAYLGATSAATLRAMLFVYNVYKGDVRAAFDYPHFVSKDTYVAPPVAAITTTNYGVSSTPYSATSSTFSIDTPVYANGTLNVDYTLNIAPGHGKVDITYSYEDINGSTVGTPSTFQGLPDGATLVYDLTIDNLAANGVAKVNITASFTDPTSSQLGSIITKTVDLSTL
jgi:hypothetical protein